MLRHEERLIRKESIMNIFSTQSRQKYNKKGKENILYRKQEICCFKFRKCLLFEYIWQKMSWALQPIFESIEWKRVFLSLYLLIWLLCKEIEEKGMNEMKDMEKLKESSFFSIYEYRMLSLFVKPLETPWEVRINIFNIEKW